MKKRIILVMAIIASVSYSLIRNNKEPMNDIVLANIEALAEGEIEEGYVCYGSGSVICPYSGKQVAGYYKKFSLK